MKIEAGDACLACHKKVADHPVVHMPVAASACDECHTAPAGKSGTIGLKAGATRERTAPLCISCHEAIGAAMKLSGAHAPVATGDCIGCHDPHGADAPFLLLAKTSELCLSCHDTVAEAVKQSSPHAPAAANCTLCHDAHGTPHRLQLRAVVNPLCQSCHLGAPPAAGSKAAVVFGRELTEDEMRFLRDAKRISLEPLARFGHPSFSHPVTGASKRKAREAVVDVRQLSSAARRRHAPALPVRRAWRNRALHQLSQVVHRPHRPREAARARQHSRRGRAAAQEE